MKKLIVLLLLAPCGIQAATLKVEKLGGPGIYTTIAAALANSSDNDVIAIGPGIYTESILIETSVRLVGTGPQYVSLRAVTDDPQRQNAITIGVVGNSAPTPTLDGLSISSAAGSGVYLSPFSSVNILNCVIADCAAHGFFHYSRGSSLYDNSTAHLTMRNCTIANTGAWGVHFITRYGGSVQIDDCILFNCYPGNPNSMAMGADYTSVDVSIGRVVLNPGRGLWTRDGNANVTRTPIDQYGSLDFLDPSHGNYILGSNSKAKNAGMPGLGAQEVDGSPADSGAYGGPGAARFWPYPVGGPRMTDMTLSPGAVIQGGKVTVKATATTR